MIDPRIKLRHVNSFLETIRLGGVARAGEALGLSQPAISKGLAELEAILGVALFDRSRRALTLTDAGEMFARFAQASLATLQQGLDSLEAAQTGSSVVALGALPTVAAGVIPRALLRFSQGPLACRTVIESGPSRYLLGLLRTAAIDFVVGRLARPEAMDGLSFEQLYAEHLVFAVRAGHPLAVQGRVSLQQVAAFQLLMPPRDAIIRPEIDALLISGGVGRITSEVETVSNSLGRSYALTSDAVWVISESVVREDFASGQLARLDLDMRATLGPIGITTRTGAEMSPQALEFLAAIRSAAADEEPLRALAG